MLGVFYNYYDVFELMLILMVINVLCSVKMVMLLMIYSMEFLCVKVVLSGKEIWVDVIVSDCIFFFKEELLLML